MDVYVIYEKPKDYPEHFVVRRWRVSAEGHMLLGGHFLCKSVELARSHIPENLIRMPRLTTDDPVIAEVWL